ncbi:hypothetical protein [Cerasicoccus maritimus]|uniref:hypothetical protein n=1 Tax=Cerasicoccus maritimus TaxID=490089 RepID=UPI00285298F8|nr:hypothetical protein [Cerasicoccus maritimus]
MLKAPLSSIPDSELIALRALLRVEMRRRGIADNVGAVGEQLAIEHFKKTSGLPKLQLAPPGTKNVDALSRNGDRFSIKTVCEGSKTGTIYPDSDDETRQLFECILIVLLDKDWSLKAIYQFSWSQFVESRSWDKRMNAWYLAVSRRTLEASVAVFST